MGGANKSVHHYAILVGLLCSDVQFKIFLLKLKGLPNLFVTGEFLYSQFRNKEENTEGTEDLFSYRQIFVTSVFVRTIFDCIMRFGHFNPVS